MFEVFAYSADARYLLLLSSSLSRGSDMPFSGSMLLYPIHKTLPCSLVDPNG